MAPAGNEDPHAASTATAAARRLSGGPLPAGILESLPDALVAFDPSGAVVLATSRADELFGYAPGTLVGQNVEQLLPQRLRDRFRHEREAFLADPASRTVVALAVQRRDGSEREVDVSVTVAEVDGRVVTVATVTERLARRRLESRLVDAQKYESIGRLAIGVVHDFNNALTSISAYAHLALSRLPPGEPVHEDVRQIVRSTEHAGRLVTQLQAFSRGERVEVELVDLNQSVRDVSRLLQVVLGEAVEVELRLAPRLPNVEANVGALEQAIMHLALNARDALPGRGQLRIETSLAELPDGPRVVLGVVDSGAGMDEAARRRAFEPFFSTKPGCTGLGLTSVHALAERLRGHVELDSAPGKGTAVRLFLPVAAFQARGPGLRATPILGTVLMVEDEETLRAVVDRILTEEGYRVLTAASGEEALELAGREPGTIDLLVSDVVLGGMTGPELATSLRARRPSLKVLLMSGYAGMPVGPVDDFLPKPFSPFELARRIRRVLRP